MQEAAAEEIEADVSFWDAVKLNKPEWKSITAASAASVLSGFAMPLLGVILGDFIGVICHLTPGLLLNCSSHINLMFKLLQVLASPDEVAQTFALQILRNRKI